MLHTHPQALHILHRLPHSSLPRSLAIPFIIELPFACALPRLSSSSPFVSSSSCLSPLLFFRYVFEGEVCKHSLSVPPLPSSAFPLGARSAFLSSPHSSDVALISLFLFLSFIFFLLFSCFNYFSYCNVCFSLFFFSILPSCPIFLFPSFYL